MPVEFEMECEKCGGRLLVTTPGQVVACPHCGAHLTTPDLPGDSDSDSVFFDERDESADDQTEFEASVGLERQLSPEETAGDQSAQEAAAQENDTVTMPTTESVDDEETFFDAVLGAEETEPETELQPFEPPKFDDFMADVSTFVASTEMSVSAPESDSSPVDLVPTQETAASAGEPVVIDSPQPDQSEPTPAVPPAAIPVSPAADSAAETPGVPAAVPVAAAPPAAFPAMSPPLSPPDSPPVSDAAVFPPAAPDVPANGFPGEGPPPEEPLKDAPSNWDFLSQQPAPAAGAVVAGEQSPGGMFPSLGESALAVSTPALSLPSSGEMPTSAAMSSGEIPATKQVSSRRGVPVLLFLLTLSYASAVTIALVFLYLQTQRAKPHDLESLPDLQPPMKNGEIALTLVPESAPMPPGHTLKLGESQQFGSLRVTPMRVVKEPIHFVHFSADRSITHAPSEPVYKLWLKFENVSKDQTFTPLDAKLISSRVPRKNDMTVFRANNFLCQADKKAEPGSQVLLYDAVSTWDLQGQKLGTVLKPGEVWETYVATTEDGVGSLKGELIWRLHFRKGYNPESFRGVTTVIEVTFKQSEITASAPSAAGKKA